MDLTWCHMQAEAVLLQHFGLSEAAAAAAEKLAMERASRRRGSYASTGGVHTVPFVIHHL